MSKLIFSLVFLALLPSAAFPQITPDSSLRETEKSIVAVFGQVFFRIDRQLKT